MNDSPQAKEVLLLEIDYLRKRLRSLEEDLVRLDADADKAWEFLNPREERKPFDGVVSLRPDFDGVEARGVDVSQGGVCFEAKHDLGLVVRLEEEGVVTERRGMLAWAQRTGDGRIRVGVEYTRQRGPARR